MSLKRTSAITMKINQLKLPSQQHTQQHNVLFSQKLLGKPISVTFDIKSSLVTIKNNDEKWRHHHHR